MRTIVDGECLERGELYNETRARVARARDAYIKINSLRGFRATRQARVLVYCCGGDWCPAILTVCSHHLCPI